MVNDRFIRLLTKELCDELTDAEREELTLLLQGNKEYRDQKEILKDYWERDRAGYEANAAMFKKVIEKIKDEERASPGGNPGKNVGGQAGNPEDDRSGDYSGERDEELSDPVGHRIFSRVAGYRPAARYRAAVWYSAAAVILL